MNAGDIHNRTARRKVRKPSTVLQAPARILDIGVEHNNPAGETSMRAIAVAAALLCAPLFCASVQARCSVPNFSFPFGQEQSTPSSAMMYVSSGERCNIKLREAGNSIFKSIAIVARPAHGAVASQNSVNLTYQPRAGYAGSDTFTFAVKGTKNGVPSTSRITVSVNVEESGYSGAQVAAASSGIKSGGTRTAKLRQASRAAASPTGLRLKCLKEAGASPDPITGRWTMYFTERDGASRTDMFRLCMAGGDRQKAKTIVVREQTRNPGSSLPYPTRP